MPRTVSVQLDDETALRLEHALLAAGASVGVQRLSKSLFLRRLIARGLDDPRPLFDQGFLEGYRAGFAATMRHFQTVFAEVMADPSKVAGLQEMGMARLPWEDGGDDT